MVFHVSIKHKKLNLHTGGNFRGHWILRCLLVWFLETDRGNLRIGISEIRFNALQGEKTLKFALIQRGPPPVCRFSFKHNWLLF